MKRLLRYEVLCILCLLASTVQGRKNSDNFPLGTVEISFYAGATVSEVSKVGSASCSLDPGSPCQGVYSLSRDGSVVRIGKVPVANDQDEPVYELWFVFGLEEENEETEFVAQFHSFRLDQSGEIQAGKRIAVTHPFEYDSPQSRTFDCGNGRQVTISYTLQGDGAFGGEMTVGQGPHTISLRTKCFSPEATSLNSLTHDLVKVDAEPYLFRMNFAQATSDSPSSALTYTVRVTCDPPIESLKFPFKTTVHFSRQYRLSTDTPSGRVSGSFPSPRRSTGAVFTKEIELVQGKLLKLVFPPDKESQGGYRIEDTLIINP